MNTTTSVPLLDRCGALASVACLLHCVGLPLLVAALPGLGIPHENEALHLALLALAVPLAAVALQAGFRRHGRVGPMLVGGLGLVLLMGTALVAGEHAHHEELEFLAASGSVALLVAHLWNGVSADSCCAEPATVEAI